MPSLTDPARELADLCALASNCRKPSTRGDEHLAEIFGVPAWSADFFQIIFVISKRIDDLSSIIGNLEIDEDIRNEAINHLSQIKNAFSQSGLNNAWDNSMKNFISPTQVGPIKMLAPTVRLQYSYPKLEQDEQNELSGEVQQLIDWLQDHQLSEQDFIRQAIVDGLTQFKFRLDRVGWLGWGYTLQSLREVIGAYLALERHTEGASTTPDAEAVLRKTGKLIETVFTKVKIFEDVASTAGFMLKAYGATVLLIKGQSSIAGLIEYLGP